ncbi:MAG: hypothetical protein QOE31_2053, partial [Solirubrobacteraceae bacterium]|nr:hypothetical protein [Solirubrobacteraceae bacterium]
MIEAKPSDYYAHDRPELVRDVPRPIGRVLDVGCGEGRVGRALRDAGADWLSGIEVVGAAAELAREAY